MKPVWLEDWSDLIVEDVRFRQDGWEDRLHLAAAAPALVRGLLMAEWSSEEDVDNRECSVCRGQVVIYDWQNARHAPECAIDAVLAAAGFPDQKSRDEARKILAEASSVKPT